MFSESRRSKRPRRLSQRFDHRAREQRRLALAEQLEQRLLLAGDGHPHELSPQQLALTYQASYSSQTVHLSVDGAENVDLDGSLAKRGINAPAFQPPERFDGQRDWILDGLTHSLSRRFPGFEFSTREPDDVNHSTIYIGGHSRLVSDGPAYLGLAEQIDVGNQDLRDEAFVFTETFASGALTPEQYVGELTELVSHELGHLLGGAHEWQVPDSDPLAELAFKPYTHIETATDVRRDLLDALCSTRITQHSSWRIVWLYTHIWTP